MTFKEIYNNIPNKSPKTVWVEKIAVSTKKHPITVRMWLCGRQNPDELAKSVISMELGIPVEELFPTRK